MVRCEDFYKYFEKKGNFCGKSEGIVKQVESYIDYVKRHKLREFGGYKISNSALDPFMSIENVNNGKVHALALKDLRNMIRRGRILPEKITRRISIEIINGANSKVIDGYKLDRIPNIRSRMGEFEHEIGEIGYDVKEMFDGLKENIGAKNNNEAMRVILELCVRNVGDMAKIKDELEAKMASEQSVEVAATQ
jgi:hypothetical protein